MNKNRLLCVHFLLRLLALLSIASLVSSKAGRDNSVAVDEYELIELRELPKLVHWHGSKQTDLAPESRIVGVRFEARHFTRGSFDATIKVASNSSKQSQEFDSVVPTKPDTTSSTGGAPEQQVSSLESTTALPSAVLMVTASSQASTSQEASSTPAAASTTESGEPNDDSFTPTAPVASKVSRQGSAVFCGEANPNGKSNKRLVLDRIVGGRKTEPGEFPFQVRLNIRSRRGSGICGGVIIDENHILTAAHCMTACVSQYLTTATIENTGVHATLGDHSIRSNDGELEIDIAKITPHEKYDACNFYANDHDIAIIKTSSPIEYKFTTDGYGSINRPCMPASSDISYKEGESVIVSGWGVTRENSGSLSNILRYVQVPVVNVTRCQETYGSRVTNDHVCAGYQSGGRDSCQGDSGGPLVRVVDNKYELVGIVSFGYGCGQPGAPGVYTRVASYIDWIKANL